MSQTTTAASKRVREADPVATSIATSIGGGFRGDAGRGTHRNAQARGLWGAGERPPPQTVNLPAQPSEVRILPGPPALMSPPTCWRVPATSICDVHLTQTRARPGAREARPVEVPTREVMEKPRSPLTPAPRDRDLARAEIAAHIESRVAAAVKDITTALGELSTLAAHSAPTATPEVAPRLLTTTQVAETLSLGESTVRELIRSGELESVKIGTARRVPLEALDAFVSHLSSEAGR